MTLAAVLDPAAVDLTTTGRQGITMKLQSMGELARTHTCGELRACDAGSTVVLAGWVHRRRDLGGLLFVDLRDRYGTTQIVFRPEDDAELLGVAGELGAEYVIAVKGDVAVRPGGTANTELPTGEVELIVREMRVLNDCLTPPFVLEEPIKASDDLRLEYRYLDLRRAHMQRLLMARHRAAKAARDYLSDKGLLEIETPMLAKKTPEGARDFIVPSRIHPGKVYALPQSPQLYKQILMVSGFDRYFQIARCLRDEGLRADRQPEHTQIDIEMSFVTQDDIFALTEGLMVSLWQEVLGRKVDTPFPHLTYADAMARYGSDKPDTRFGMELIDVTDLLAGTDFRVFRQAVESGGAVKCLVASGYGDWSRSRIDKKEELAKSWGAKGLAHAKVTDGTLEGGISKFLSEAEITAIIERAKAVDGDLLLFGADTASKVNNVLGRLRLAFRDEFDLAPDDVLNFLWVTDFPMFAFNEDANAWEAEHHMFTMPRDEDIEYLETDPGRVLGQLYDLVLNGVEMASGSIRIHRRDIQERVMSVVGMSAEDAEERFGFLLKAFDYGAPPHGGIAPGLDRIVMMLMGEDSIRDVIAFPKTYKGLSLMDGSPSELEQEVMEELHLKFTK